MTGAFTPGVSVETVSEGVKLTVRELVVLAPGTSPQKREASIVLDKAAAARLAAQFA